MTYGESPLRCARPRWPASCASPGGVRLNAHLEHDCGLTVFQHACKMGLEGIVSKRLGSHYRSGRSPERLKFKNPEAPAVKREAEEEWGRLVSLPLEPPRPRRTDAPAGVLRLSQAR